MSGTKDTRLAALEKKRPAGRRRIVRIVSGEGQEAEVRQLLLAQGIDPGARDLLVVERRIVAPDGKEPHAEPPSILSVTETTDARRRSSSHEAEGEPTPRRPKRRKRKTVTEDGRSE